MKRPLIVIFDSGLGGLSVFSAVRKARYDADFLFIADNGGFPYGDLSETEIIDRGRTVFQMLAKSQPTLGVIACNTASTILLPYLRRDHDFPIVGTVPAIKPAAELTHTGVVSVIATPGTLRRDYTRQLISDFASHVHVRLVGAPYLASYVEEILALGMVDNADLLREVQPAFFEAEARPFEVHRTDTVVLACTHYPLILQRLQSIAPWKVRWIDPAPAIANRVSDLLRQWPVVRGNGMARVVLTKNDDSGRFTSVFKRFGLESKANQAAAT